MTIHHLKLTERDHSRTERIVLPGMVGGEFETPVGNLSVSVHGQVYLRTKERTIPLTVTETDALMRRLLHLTNVARNQLRIREGVANDCEAVSGKSRLWRRRGGALKKARKR